MSRWHSAHGTICPGVLERRHYRGIGDLPIGPEPSVLWRAFVKQPKSCHSGYRLSTDIVPWNASHSEQPGDAEPARAGGADCAKQCRGADYRRKWLRERTYRARGASFFAARLQNLGGCELRRAAGKSGGKRAIRI